jgi:hypothetical protein
MTPDFKPGDLVAVVSAIDRSVVRRIARVVQVNGNTVTVESDSQVEGDAAVEYDFDTPPPVSMSVHWSLLRRIVS